MEMGVQQWLHIFIACSSPAPPPRCGIQILAAPLTCSPRMIYAAMQRRSRATSTAIARVGVGVGASPSNVFGICEKLSDISEFVGSHRC